MNWANNIKIAKEANSPMDPKLNTFLTVCETMNYHTAARLLHPPPS